MSLQELKRAIEVLPPEEWDELVGWVEERQADLWDEQIEQDAAAGKLDALFAQAHADYVAGRTLPFPCERNASAQKAK